MRDESSGGEIVVVADLHMSSGRDPATGALSRSEDFHRDGAFGRFLDWRLRDGRARRRRWRLLVLGDFLDFTRVELGRSGGDQRRLDMSEAAALAKLERIAAGHPRVFEALRRLPAGGVSIDIVPGNHDLELLHGAVQARLRELLARDSQVDGAAVSVHPWIFHVPGVLYAEHGHQHHDINRVPGMAIAEGAERLDPPIGSRLGEWMTAVIDAADPRGSLQPSFRRLLDAVRGHPAALAATWRAHLALLTALTRVALGRRRGGASAHETGYALAARAAALRLPPETLAELDSLGARSFPETALRLMRVGLEGLRRPSGGPGAAPGDAGGGYMRSAATAVHGLLTAVGEPATCYVFAHTHAAERAPLAGPVPATYLNTGTWSSLQRDPSSPPTFVEVDAAGVGARLRAWNDRAGRAEEVASSSRPPESARPPAVAAAARPPARQRA